MYTSFGSCRSSCLNSSASMLTMVEELSNFMPRFGSTLFNFGYRRSRAKSASRLSSLRGECRGWEVEGRVSSSQCVYNAGAGASAYKPQIGLPSWPVLLFSWCILVRAPRKSFIFIIEQMLFMASKYPKRISFHVENKLSVAQTLAAARYLYKAASFLAETSVTSPRKLLIFIIYKNLSG